MLGCNDSAKSIGDCVTLQLKALAALMGIFKEHSVDELGAILLTWVRFNPKIGLLELEW